MNLRLYKGRFPPRPSLNPCEYYPITCVRVGYGERELLIHDPLFSSQKTIDWGGLRRVGVPKT